MLKIFSADDVDDDDPIVYCLQHGIKYVKDNPQQKQHCKLYFTHSMTDIQNLIKKINDRINSPNQKKKSLAQSTVSSNLGSGNNSKKNAQSTSTAVGRYSGMPTLLK